MPVSRRDALRLSIPAALGPYALLSSLTRAAAAAIPYETSLRVTDSTEGWTVGVAKATDDEGKPAIAFTSASDGAVANLQYALGSRTAAVAHARQIRFRYRVDGSPAVTLHFKIVAAPLASGFQAVFRLPFPRPGEWNEATLPVQEYAAVWGANGTPQTSDGGDNGALQFRIAKPAETTVTLTIGEMWLVPLPKGAPVNTSADPSGKPAAVRPSDSDGADSDAPPPPLLLTPKVAENFAAAGYPRLQFSKADTESIRKRARDTAWGRDMAAQLMRRADVALAQDVALPDKGGQWSHWYVCPRHGRTLKPDGPHRHVCTIDGEVFTGYPYDDVLLTDVHNDYALHVRDLGFAFQLSGEERYAAKARQILLGYAQKYPDYPLHDVNNRTAVGGGKAMAETVAEANWLISLAQGCDMVWETLSPDERTTLKTRLFLPAASDVIKPHTSGIDGDECRRLAAVGMVGALFGERSLLAWALDDRALGFSAQIFRGTSPDGQWFDGRWFRHFEALDALTLLAEAARGVGIDVYRSAEVGERFRRMFLLPVQMQMPDGSLPTFDDNSFGTPDANPNYEIAFARWNDPLLALPVAADTGRRSREALIAGAEILPTPLPARASINLTDSGYAILRSPASDLSPACFALKYGPAGGIHAHPDKLSFAFFSHGRTDVDNPGPAAERGSKRDTDWNRTTFAHNTLVVDERSQQPATGKCLAFLPAAVLADAGPIYDGVRYGRGAFLLGASTAVLVDIAESTDGQSHTFDFVLHPSGTWGTPPPVSGPFANRSRGYDRLSDVLTTPLAGGASALLSFNENFRVVVGTASTNPARILSAMQAGPSDKEQNPCIVVRHMGATLVVQATLLLSGPPAVSEAIVSLERNPGLQGGGGRAVAARVVTGDGSYLLVTNPEGETVRFGSDYSGSDRLAVVPLKS